MFRSILLALRAKCRFNPATCTAEARKTVWFVLASFTVYRFQRDLPRPQIVLERRQACANCSIYDRRLKTCGTPGELRDKQPLGCWCWMPAKEKLNVNCWLWEKSNGILGWPDHLNTKPR